MTASTWFLTTFPYSQNQSGDPMIHFYRESSGYLSAPLSFLEQKFSFATSFPPKYAALMASDLVAQGWTFVFEQWQAIGIIK